MQKFEEIGDFIFDGGIDKISGNIDMNFFKCDLF